MEPTLYVNETASSVSSGTYLIYGLVWLVLTVLAIVAMWKIFEKAGKPGWAAIVPFYNVYTLLQVAGYNGWWMLLVFVGLVPVLGWLVAPFVSLALIIMIAIGLGKNFNKSTMFVIFGLIFFSFIGYLMLGFGSDKYVGGGKITPSEPAATPPAAA